MKLPIVPHLYWARDLEGWNNHTAGKLGVWVMARPLGFYGLCLSRHLALAWGVFTGKYDAVRWTEPM